MHRVVVEVLEGTIPPPILGNTIISTSPCYLDEYQFSIPMDQANDLTNSGKILTGENEIVFYAGNPTVESIKGILHLCKGTNERFIQVTENHESTFEPCEMTAIPVEILFSQTINIKSKIQLNHKMLRKKEAIWFAFCPFRVGCP